MMFKKLAGLVCGIGLAMLASVATADDARYTTLDTPVDTHAPADKIVVQELFWYGCPHCYHFEPDFEKWKAKQAKDVVIESIPATMNGASTRHATLYYAAKELGIIDKVHEPLFEAVQQGKMLLKDDDVVALFAEKAGVSKESTLKALNSFGVKSQVNRAHATLLAYRLMGVPAMVINGQYVISPDQAGSLENMLHVADQLIAEQRTKKAKS